MVRDRASVSPGIATTGQVRRMSPAPGTTNTLDASAIAPVQSRNLIFSKLLENPDHQSVMLIGSYGIPPLGSPPNPIHGIIRSTPNAAAGSTLVPVRQTSARPH